MSAWNNIVNGRTLDKIEGQDLVVTLNQHYDQISQISIALGVIGKDHRLYIPSFVTWIQENKKVNLDIRMLGRLKTFFRFYDIAINQSVCYVDEMLPCFDNVFKCCEDSYTFLHMTGRGHVFWSPENFSKIFLYFFIPDNAHWIRQTGGLPYMIHAVELFLSWEDIVAVITEHGTAFNIDNMTELIKALKENKVETWKKTFAQPNQLFCMDSHVLYDIYNFLGAFDTLDDRYKVFNAILLQDVPIHWDLDDFIHIMKLFPEDHPNLNRDGFFTNIADKILKQYRASAGQKAKEECRKMYTVLTKWFPYHFFRFNVLKEKATAKRPANTLLQDNVKRHKIDGISVLCICCQDKSPSVVFSPCGHLSCCMTCSNQIMGKNSKCPSCNAIVTDTIEVFLQGVEPSKEEEESNSLICHE